MGSSLTVEIDGLKELQRNLNKINRGAGGAVRKGLRKAAKPVAKNIEAKATEEISRIGPQWSRMRIGNPAGQVYIAPRMRNRGGSPRPNLFGLLKFRAMFPGALEKRREFVKAVEDEFDDLARSAGF